MAGGLISRIAMPHPPSELRLALPITGLKPFACTQCGKSFGQKGTLKLHIKSVHDDNRDFVSFRCYFLASIRQVMNGMKSAIKPIL